MNTLSGMDLLFILFVYANAVWALLVYIMSLLAVGGTKISEKAGTMKNKTYISAEKRKVSI